MFFNYFTFKTHKGLTQGKIFLFCQKYIIDNRGRKLYNVLMKKFNLHVSREQLFLIVYKTLYIVMIIASLCVLQLALNKGAEGYEYVSEEFLRPLCDDIMAYNFFLFGSSLVFIGFFWNLCKVLNQYSSMEWIFTAFLNNYLSTPFGKYFIFYTFILGKR